ncbi:MAG TPA: polysaccharide deacetylase family protein [Solirubrobacteraceae bacterium]
MSCAKTTCVLGILAALALAAGCGGASSSTSTHTPAAAQPSQTTAQSTTRAVPALIPPAGAAARSVQVPVLTYHRVAPLSAVGQLDLKVDPANFAAELQALHDGGYHTISQSQLFAAIYKGTPLPSRPVMISVDDGYIDDVRTILPELQRRHMVATFFVITGRMTEPGFLSAAQIRELDRAGMDVGDHTAHHVDLRTLTPSELTAETAGSRHALEQVLGHPVYYFAYPYGTFDATVVQAVRAAGFTMGYTTQGGITESTADPLTWPRIHVSRAQTPSGLIAALGGV